MNELADLIRALADLAWPLVVGAFLYAFRNEFAGLFARLRKFSGPAGVSGEFDPALDSLEKAARSAGVAVGNSAQGGDDIALTVRKVLEEAATSPRAALMLLSAEIEREARDLAALRGLLEGRRRPVGGYRDLASILERVGVQRDVIGALREFYDVRNKIVHGHDARDEEILRAVDSGTKILDTLHRVPREVNFVHRTDVPIYEDESGEVQRQDVAGLMLRTVSAEGEPEQIRIFPTTRNGYREGEPVAWEWSKDLSWPESWYRDPDTGDVKYAWTVSAEFVGRHLSDL